MSSLQARSAAVLARIATLANRLGIDTSGLDLHLPRLALAIIDSAQVWIDSDGERLAVGCSAVNTVGYALLDRPGLATVEVETAAVPDRIAIKRTVLQARTMAEDLAWLAEHNVSPAAREQLATWLFDLAGRGPDFIGQRVEGDQTKWFAGFAIAGELSALVAMLRPTLAVAEAIGVLELRMIQETLLALGVPGGVAITLACDQHTALPQIAIEFSEVAWPTAIGLVDTLRPGSPCAPRLGALAGAFDAERASAVEVTFRAQQPPRIRVAASAPAG